MEIELWKKIPVDVFINHIMPYTYKKQDTNLLNDIRNFVFDYRMIVNYYFFDLNEYCLLVDLISAINKITPQLREYIMQTASMLIESDILKYIAKMATDGAASTRFFLEGGGKKKLNRRKIPKKYII